MAVCADNMQQQLPAFCLCVVRVVVSPQAEYAAALQRYKAVCADDMQ
jgi:hypothetical protein